MDGEGGRFSASLLSLLPSWLFRSRACAEEKIEKKKLIGWRAILGTLMKIQVTFCFYTCTYSTLNQFLFMVIQSSISIFFSGMWWFDFNSFASEAISFIMKKLEIAKNIYLQICKLFEVWYGKPSDIWKISK